MNKYIAQVTISIPVEAKDADDAYDTVFDDIRMEYILPGTSIYIENIEIKEGQQ